MKKISLMKTILPSSQKTEVVHVRKQVFDVYIGRGSMFGNPHRMRDESKAERTRVIEAYQEWFKIRLQDPKFVSELEKLRGKRLGCFCAPKRCHGDIIVEYLEGEEKKK
jgi:hypothetical protein